MIQRRWFLGVAAFGGIGLLLGGCDMNKNKMAGGKPATRPVMTPMSIEKSDFGKTGDNQAVDLYTMTNTHGMVAKVMTYGAILTELHVPDRNGKSEDVVLGFDNLKQYLDGHPFFGAIAGRVANRIAKGTFNLNGKVYHLDINNPPNSLHGGKVGFDKKVWTAVSSTTPNGPSVTLTYVSADGEEGYPGTLTTNVTYTLTNNNELKIDYKAVTDKPTILNLTNHSYWNLHGAGSDKDILDHVMMINANDYTPVDATLIPTGELAPVKGTIFDFTGGKPIGQDIEKTTGTPNGYDHNFVLKGPTDGMKMCAKVSDPVSGRVMEIWTSQPGVQFYTGNFLDGKLTGIGGVPYTIHYAFCLETQHYPDSINHPRFPSTVLNPGQVFTSTTIHRFSTK